MVLLKFKSAHDFCSINRGVGLGISTEIHLEGTPKDSYINSQEKLTRREAEKLTLKGQQGIQPYIHLESSSKDENLTPGKSRKGQHDLLIVVVLFFADQKTAASTVEAIID